MHLVAKASEQYLSAETSPLYPTEVEEGARNFLPGSALTHPDDNKASGSIIHLFDVHVFGRLLSATLTVPRDVIRT